MLLLKSDERERWDPRCAELEWFEEIRFNFQRQNRSFVVAEGRVCVLGGGYGKQERHLNFARYQRRAVRGWICVVSQRQTQLEKRELLLWVFGWRFCLKASFPFWEEAGAPNDVAPASLMASQGIRRSWSTSVWACGSNGSRDSCQRHVTALQICSVALSSVLQPQNG